jgi:hypothetical protein
MAYIDRYISIYTIIYNLFKSDIYEIMHYFNLQVKNELPVCGITILSQIILLQYNIIE